jgi:hypothetical protein
LTAIVMAMEKVMTKVTATAICFTGLTAMPHFLMMCRLVTVLTIFYVMRGPVEEFPASFGFLRKFSQEHALPKIKTFGGVVVRPRTRLPAKIGPCQFSDSPSPLNADKNFTKNCKIREDILFLP